MTHQILLRLFGQPLANFFYNAVENYTAARAKW